ncbi:inositol polyphosphate phosphatase [Thelephora ganbajun]|uniref:Inositol polyphosphate phosphatase n=1 Tax=Thelephora ganbajun TaxID=370292 RepID=A0ACB6ZNM9_THEGA|nr:inositol polyphosphate phosphatase [Thelephora ganbajun]
MHLYLGDDPRALYLATSQHDEKLGRPQRVLVFRVTPSNPPQAVVEFLHKDQVDLSSAVLITSRNIKGCMGLINVGGDIFVAVITSTAGVGNTRPSASTPESVARIHEVCFYSLTSSTWDDFSNSEQAWNYSDTDIINLRDNYTQSSSAGVLEHPCLPLTKILSSGSFYFALEPQWDLSTRFSERLPSPGSIEKGRAHDIANFDERFIWNEYIVRSLLDIRDRLDPQEREDLDRCQFIVLVIQGYVGIFTMALSAPPTNGAPVVATLSLISRLGWKRAGTRFNTRGIDDDGNTANFVETETIFSTDQHCFSYVQVRGSVPLFWEQQGLQTFGQRIQITRPNASQPAFERHFAQIIDEYGSVHAINLLGTKDAEATLTHAYARHLQAANSIWGSDIGITHFDFHNAVRLGGHESVIRDLKRMDVISENIDRFGFTVCDISSNEIVIGQKGVFRTNCLDCLDRTNFVQDIISRSALEQYLHLIRREWIHSGTLWSYHRELWAENGDALSKIYAGTGALNTSFTRSGKRTLAGVLSDATKSVSRAYISNFQDKSKQTAIDMFLGNLSDQQPVTIFDPIHDTVRVALEQRRMEYSSPKHCMIFTGTWNLNGRPPSTESLMPWLFPRPVCAVLTSLIVSDLTEPRPDMFVLGFQEIVPLTAQQIIQTDPEKRRVWETRLMDVFDRRGNKTCDYVLLRSEQLVGTALIIFVKSELTSVIRNVEATTRKTGMRGMSGNKGAVAIRLQYHDTNFCFITAHLAAGHPNVEERNSDYRTIVNQLRFQKGKTIASHQNVVWLADTNYRIDLENDLVRSLAQCDKFDALLAADQLRSVMDAGIAFAGYQEGPLLFRPTYRYDVGTDAYDTSEKMRIPAWTDRILYHGSLDLAVYSRAELKSSDHRPVFALFRTVVWIVDRPKRDALARLLLENVTSTPNDEKLDEKLAALTLHPSTHDLPPPSSEDNAWWDRPGHPNGVFVVTDAEEARYRSANPFDSPTDSPLSSSPSLSDEELYTAALQDPLTPAQVTIPTIVRKPPPLPSRASKPS